MNKNPSTFIETARSYSRPFSLMAGLEKKGKTKFKMTRDKAKETAVNRDIGTHHRLLMDFMNNVPDVIYFKDTKGRLILVNKAHAKGLGLKPEEVAGKTDFDIFPKKRAQRMAKDDEYVFKTGKPIIDKIERATRPDGLDNYVSTTKIPRYDNKGKLVGLIGITRDVTRRMHLERIREERVRMEKKLELLEEMNRIKSDFISAVSHELRTPLAIVKQLVMLIYEETAGPLTHKQKEILVKTRHNIDRLKNIIDQLLDISRIERKKLSLHYSLVNLNDLLKDSAEFFNEMAGEKNITLNYHLPKNEIIIFIDAERIIQIVTNLINNAIKFTEENGTIDVEVKVLETKVRIGVIDTGIGIAAEDLPKVFSKFVQVSKSESTEKKGVGLGLSIVKELVEKHGGEIWAESRLGVGSKFYFTLPRYYTANILAQEVKDKINRLLDEGLSVYLINLLIVNYDEFKKKIHVGPLKLFNDLKDIMNSVFQELFKREKGRQQISITDMHRGRYSIIFPKVTAQKVNAYCELLREKTKNYFTRNRIDNVFIAMGILSYPSRQETLREEKDLDNLIIKEIYIGSEIRRYKRINYKTTIAVSFPDGRKSAFQTVDISQGGICFTSDTSLATDTEVKIQVELLKKKASITAKARVAWIKKVERLPTDNTDKYKIGLEFTKMENKDKAVLSKELKLYYE